MSTLSILNKEDILAAYRYRHATKEFDPAKPVSEEDFQFILETGHLSPSSFGFEPWKFLVVQNKELREKLAPVSWGAQKQLATAPYFVIMLSGTKQTVLPDSEYIQAVMREVQQLSPESAKGKTSRFHAFLSEDFDLLDNERAVFEWSSRQSYIALGNMMTAAAQIGIDSCPMEGFDKKEVEAILQQEGLLDRDKYGVSVMVAFGYRVSEPRAKTRRPLDQVVQWVK